MIPRKRVRQTSMVAAFCALLVATSGARAGEPITLTARLAQPVMKGGEAGRTFCASGSTAASRSTMPTAPR